MDCLVEALAGNVGQARLMKNTRRPYPSLSGSLPAAVCYRSRAVSPSPFGARQPPFRGRQSTLDANWYQELAALLYKPQSMFIPLIFFSENQRQLLVPPLDTARQP